MELEFYFVLPRGKRPDLIFISTLVCNIITSLFNFGALKKKFHVYIYKRDRYEWLFALLDVNHTQQGRNIIFNVGS